KCPRDVKELMCGVNGLTYLNPCFAEESNVEIAYKGECRKNEKPEIACTEDYNPVCGVDGKTYSNKCTAMEQNGVKVSYEGECRATEKLPQTTSCSKEKELVCGENGMTYLNSCFAKDANVVVAYAGACKAGGSTKATTPTAPTTSTISTVPVPQSTMQPAETVQICPKTPDYVCGVNNLNYLNDCFAKQSNVVVAYKGYCKAADTSQSAESAPTTSSTQTSGAVPASTTNTASGVEVYPATATISMKGSIFSPSSVMVAPGAKLIFVNDDKLVHNVRGMLSSASDAKPGASITVFAPSKPGTYSYYCGYHSTMKGTVIVK
ncbi:MAG: Kazal-type serine protease inhibitor domain-containing protein, partial [Patescibacteria group bacterium]